MEINDVELDTLVLHQPANMPVKYIECCHNCSKPVFSCVMTLFDHSLFSESSRSTFKEHFMIEQKHNPRVFENFRPCCMTPQELKKARVFFAQHLIMKLMVQ